MVFFPPDSLYASAAVFFKDGSWAKTSWIELNVSSRSSASLDGVAAFVTVTPGRDSKSFLIDSASKNAPPGPRTGLSDTSDNRATYSCRSRAASTCMASVPEPSDRITMVCFIEQETHRTAMRTAAQLSPRALLKVMRHVRVCRGRASSAVAWGAGTACPRPGKPVSIRPMPTVHITPPGKSLVAAKGSILRDILTREGILLDYPCGGKGSCRKCRVTVDPPPASGKGNLKETEITDGVRLACQLALFEDC